MTRTILCAFVFAATVPLFLAACGVGTIEFDPKEKERRRRDEIASYWTPERIETATELEPLQLMQLRATAEDDDGDERNDSPLPRRFDQPNHFLAKLGDQFVEVSIGGALHNEFLPASDLEPFSNADIPTVNEPVVTVNEDDVRVTFSVSDRQEDLTRVVVRLKYGGKRAGINVVDVAGEGGEMYAEFKGLRPGNYEAVIVAKDLEGNKARRETTFRVGQDGPSVTPLVPQGGVSLDGPTVQFRFTSRTTKVTDFKVVVRHGASRLELGPEWNGRSTYTATATLHGNGPHQWQVLAGGQPATAWIPFTVTRDGGGGTPLPPAPDIEFLYTSPTNGREFSPSSIEFSGAIHADRIDRATLSVRYPRSFSFTEISALPVMADGGFSHRETLSLAGDYHWRVDAYVDGVRYSGPERSFRVGEGAPPPPTKDDVVYESPAEGSTHSPSSVHFSGQVLIGGTSDALLFVQYPGDLIAGATEINLSTDGRFSKSVFYDQPGTYEWYVGVEIAGDLVFGPRRTFSIFGDSSPPPTEPEFTYDYPGEGVRLSDASVTFRGMVSGAGVANPMLHVQGPVAIDIPLNIDSYGHFSETASMTSDGTYTWYVSAMVDGGRRYGPVRSFEVVANPNPDSRTIKYDYISPARGATVSDPVTFEWQVTSPEEVLLVLLYVVYPDGEEAFLTRAPTPDGRDIVTLPLDAGVGTYKWAVWVQGPDGVFAEGPWREFTLRDGPRTTACPENLGRYTLLQNHERWSKPIGRIYFTVDGKNYLCSGTLVEGANDRAIIATAAHCVWDATAQKFPENVMFIPGQDDGGNDNSDLNCSNDPFGCFYPTAGVISDKYRNASYSQGFQYDYGFYIAPDDDPGPDNGPDDETYGGPGLPDSISPHPISFDGMKYGANTFLMGYPGNRDPHFLYTEGRADASPITLGGWYVQCSGLTGGASGGPWTQSNITGGADFVVSSVNSWGWTNGEPGMGSPPYDTGGARCVYESALSADLNRSYVVATCPQ